jgi:hypothetical protein
MERTVIAVGLSTAGSVFLLTIAAATVGLGPIPVVVSIVVLAGVALLRPLKAGAIESVGPVGRWGYATYAVLGVVFLVLLYQALSPQLFKLWDALTLWAPLAETIAGVGDVTPDWVPSRLSGFPASIALIAAGPGVVAGGVSQNLSYAVHPGYATFAFAGATLVGASLSNRLAGFLALLGVLAVPLIDRGIFFHDDLLVAFFTVAAVFVALRARAPEAWFIVGVLAGGAVATKHLGVVALGFVFIVWWARKGSWKRFSAMALGSAIALPWYIWSWVRLGNPVFPFLPQLFGTSAEARLMHEDQLAFLQTTDRNQVGEVGLLALILLGVGLLTFIAASWRRKDSIAIRTGVGLSLYALVFGVVWYQSGYASRQLLISLIPMFGLAGAGLSLIERVFTSTPSRASAVAQRVVVPLVVALSLVGTSVAALAFDLNTGREPPMAAQSGVYSLAAGKWSSVTNWRQNRDNAMAGIHGSISAVWLTLRGREGDAVFSYDTRTFYFPQVVLDANDTRAAAVYNATTPIERHSALLSLDVEYVMTRPWGERHTLTYPLGPWDDLARHPDLYDPVFIHPVADLYRVRTRSG